MVRKNIREEIYRVTDGKCFYCGCELDINDFHVDHVFPKKLGGKDYRNRVPACEICNLYKGELTVEEFRSKIENSRYESISGEIIDKYYFIEYTPVIFYFESLKTYSFR